MLKAFLSTLRGRSPLELLREKRRTARCQSVQELIVRTRDQAFPGRCLDQSPGGVRFECSAREAVKPGDTLELSSTERALRLTGKVAWVKSAHGRKQVGVKRDGSAGSSSSERRMFVRVSPPLMASRGDQRLKVLDVSLRGLRVQSDERLEGYTLTLDLHLPGPPLTVNAKVLEGGRIARLAIPTLEASAQKRLGDFLAGILRQV